MAKGSDTDDVEVVGEMSLDGQKIRRDLARALRSHRSERRVFVERDVLRCRVAVLL